METKTKFSILKYVGLIGLIITLFFQFRGIYIQQAKDKDAHDAEDARIQTQVTINKIADAEKHIRDSVSRVAYRQHMENRVSSLEDIVSEQANDLKKLKEKIHIQN